MELQEESHQGGKGSHVFGKQQDFQGSFGRLVLNLKKVLISCVVAVYFYIKQLNSTHSPWTNYYAFMDELRTVLEKKICS